MSTENIRDPLAHIAAESLGLPLGKIALAIVAIARALRPRDQDSLAAYSSSIQDILDRARPEQDLLRAILQAARE